jgi:hypothetical protein
MAGPDATRLPRRTRWVVVGVAAVAAVLIVVLLGVGVPLWLVRGDGDKGDCRVTAEGLERRGELQRLGMEVPADQRPDAEVGDRYTSMDGCVLGDSPVG